MSWIKSLVDRLFTSEEREEGRVEELPAEKPVTKPPFRFPLISDEEIAAFSSHKAHVDPTAADRFDLPLKNSYSDFMAPETREAPPLPPEAPLPVRPKQQAPFVPAYEAAQKPVKGPNKRYKPTRVPSPVHGFQQSMPESAQETAEDQSEIFMMEDQIKVEGLETAELYITNSIHQPDSAMETAVEPVAEMPPFSAEAEEELVLQQETAVEREKIVNEPATEEVPAAEKLVERVEKTASETTRKKERVVPFNVLMLKSDRERIKKKPAALTSETHQETIVPAEQEPAEDKQQTTSSYQKPELHFLVEPEQNLQDEEWMEEQGERLTEALSHFQVKAEIVSIVQGPAVTQFELRVANGIKVSKIRNLSDDLKLALAARDIRIQAPIPGKSSIGVEIPNRTSRPVRISEIIGSEPFLEAESPLEAALGLSLTGKPVTSDLRSMPHGLIAGATGSGKSVCINSLLISLLYKAAPADLKLLLIDPKMVELAPYNHIPHLISPVITDVKAATASLKWAVEEMERRYKLFAHTGVRDISRYNKLVKEKGDYAQHLPYILIVIDELADLMMMAPTEVEDAICRIAQKARACGIHLVIATQRPSVDVITGLIKANIPSRIAFSVSSQVDSRTILDTQGAERLLGKGDMLYLGNGMSAPVRLQGTYVTDEEIEAVINHVRSQGEPEYFFKEEELIQQADLNGIQDELFEEACRYIYMQGSASTSLLQRKFHIGYNRAARLMEQIEQHGFVSEQKGSKAREVLLTEAELEEIF